MSQEIIKVLEYLGDKLGIAIDWTAENVIPYAEQLFNRYVTLKITYASIGTFIGIVLAVTAIVLSVKLIKTYNKSIATETSNSFWLIEKRCYSSEIDMSLLGFIALVVALICGLGSIPALGCNISSLIEWIIIPEIPFAKEVASLLGTTI